MEKFTIELDAQELTMLLLAASVLAGAKKITKEARDQVYELHGRLSIMLTGRVTGDELKEMVGKILLDPQTATD